MAFIEWSSSLSIDIPSLDQEHRQIVDLINSLHEAMLDREGSRVLGTTFDQLSALTRDHFALEEHYFETLGYEHREEHIAQHRVLARRVEELRAAYERGEPGIALETLDFLREWLWNHILRHDRQYAALFHEHGIR